MAGCEPVRRFTWRQRQRHRPGLQFMVSTGRLHGFESLEERSLLLALDFTGAWRRSCRSRSGSGSRPPAGSPASTSRTSWRCSATAPGGCSMSARPSWLSDEDAVRFAAAAEAALEAGWRYSVVAGWRPHVLSVLDALSAQRRELEDRLGLQDAAAAGPWRAGRPRSGTWWRRRALPAVARAHALHLLWRRRLGIDLAARWATGRWSGSPGGRLMSGQAGLLELSAGSVLRLDGTEWTVAAVEAAVRPGAAGRGRWTSGGGASGGWCITVTARPSRQRPRKPPGRRGSR